MRAALCKHFLFILTAMLLFASPCWSKSKGYFFIVGYSFIEKAAYFSPIIVQNVGSKSYSAEEYVTEVELIQKLESQFYNHLSRSVNLDAGRFTISTRGAYKSDAIAYDKLNGEIETYEAKGFAINKVKDFAFSD